MITTVSTTDALIAALKAAQSGDTVLLAAGTYDAVVLSNLHFASAVTIASADPTHQAVLSNFSVADSSGLAFQQLTFATTDGTAATVVRSQDITFSEDSFTGSAAGVGNAMLLRDSSGVSITGSDFGKFATGINELTVSNVTISDNVFHDIPSGAIRGTGVTAQAISDNTFVDATSTATNQINLWQDNTANNVTISGNTFGPAATSTTASAAFTPASGPQTVTVHSTTELLNALKSAHSGDVIKLAAGTYDSVALSNLHFDTGAVTITSADAAHQAVLSNLTVSGSSGLTFQALNFTTTSGTAATVGSSHDITFSQDTFTGSAIGVGNAMMLRNSDTVTVTGSDFGKFGTGINELTANNVAITNNVFHDISGGAIRGTGATNETITGNTFVDAKAGVANHQDVINLWQDNTANHVTITGNSYGGVVVNSTAGLLSALKAAHAGDVIRMASGVYDAVLLSNFHFDGAVTITSVDPTHAAVFSNLTVSSSSGLSFDHLGFTTVTGTAATVLSSQNISFSDDTFVGSGGGAAMMLRSSDGLTVTGSDFGKFATGINELTASNVTISDNVFHDIPSGAIRGSGVTYETISGNTFSDAGTTAANQINLWQDNTANHVTIDSSNSFTGPTTSPIKTTTSTAPATSNSSSSVSEPVVTGPQTVTVSNSAELLAAVKAAHAGDVIKLAAGIYDSVALNSLNFGGAGVTITSADQAHRAQIKGISLGNSSGISFDHLDVSLGASGYGVYAGSSSHLSFSDMKIQGPAGTYQGVGMYVRNSTDVSFANSEITQVGSGFGHLDSDDLTISGSTFHNIAVDGVFGGGSSHVVVSGNTFTDFHMPAGAHPDAIQFFAGSTGLPGSDILVTGNVITRGSGDPIQGVFVEYTNHIEISGNALSGTMYNGIGLSTTNDALISNNFVDGYTDMGTRIIVRGASADVTVVGNTAQQIVNYAANGINPNFVAVDNTVIGAAAVGDNSAMNAWLSAHAGVTATLNGGLGNDILTGTAGADIMSGGVGNDTYVVNHPGDVVNEAQYGGVDTVNTALSSYMLSANVENLVLTGSTAQTGLGNSLDNVLVSNGVQSTLNGGDGNDVLVVMGGTATLTGGAGADVFGIAKAPTSPVLITDFAVGQDQLDLHSVLANYHGTNPVADKWVQFQTDASGTTVLVDMDGPTGSGGFVAMAKLAGVSALGAHDWVFH